MRQKSSQKPLKSCVFRGARRTPKGLKRYNPVKIRLNPSDPICVRPICPAPKIASKDPCLQFPNAVILNAVGRRHTQMRANERKRLQKSAKGRKRAQRRAQRALPRENVPEIVFRPCACSATYPKDPPVVKILRRRHGECSEMLAGILILGLSGPNRAMQRRCAMRFESHIPKSLAMQKKVFFWGAMLKHIRLI